ncbi:MAG: hypothetical protein U9R07_15740 [Pseudomonadota bacterium]|nr:hypothetical protein [Pseudomonadota bacterium]
MFAAMDQESIVADIEHRAFLADVSIATVCGKAGVNPTTFSRWKKSERNPNPTSATLRAIEKLYDALSHFESRSRRRGKRAA